MLILLIGVEQRSVESPPTLTIAVQLLLGVLIRPLGAVFATPLAAVSVVVIQHLYVEEVVSGRNQRHVMPSAEPPAGRTSATQRR